MDKNKELDLSAYHVRTDLALEAHQMAVESQKGETNIKGVRLEEVEEDGIIVTKVYVEEEGQKR